MTPSKPAGQDQIARDQQRIIEELRAANLELLSDLTAQKQAELEIRKLQAERQFLADLVACSNDAIVSRAVDGKIRSWNRAAELMFGFGAAEMIGRTPDLSPELQAEAKAVVERLHRGEPVIQYETKRRHKGGHDVQVSFTASLVRNHEGEIVGTSGILRDITERKQAEANRIALQNELAHVSRLSAMGQMSAAIAHELNQPLSAISNYLAAAQQMMDGEASLSPKLQKTREALEKAAAQTFRAAAIIRSLRDFVENRESVRAPHSLPGIIQEAVTLGMLGHAHNGITLSLDLDPATPPMLLNKVQIQQVLVNLVRNALEAMAQTGQPELKISSRSDRAGTRITVRDNGPGFSGEIASRLFQPFVTTKENGMGIGLRVCQSIVEAHDGTIEAANADPGAVFVIHLPHQDSGKDHGNS
ncbi:MAG: ATP-binding protein [Rhizomicrobium sp.]